MESIHTVNLKAIARMLTNIETPTYVHSQVIYKHTLISISFMILRLVSGVSCTLGSATGIRGILRWEVRRRPWGCKNEWTIKSYTVVFFTHLFCLFFLSFLLQTVFLFQNFILLHQNNNNNDNRDVY